MGPVTITRVDPPKKGEYRVHLSNGEVVAYPRLTRVLDLLNKPALVHWSAIIEREYVIGKALELVTADPSQAGSNFDKALRAHLGDKRAHQMFLKEAGTIGSALHKGVQHELRSQMGIQEPEPKLDEAANIAFMAWEDWAESVSLEPILVEERVASMRFKIGGTLDCAARITHVPSLSMLAEEAVECVFDWKSSKRSQTAPDGIYPEAIIQVSTYREIAVEMGLLSPDAWAAVVRLPKTLDDPCLKEKEPFDVRWIPPQEASMHARGFLSIKDAWDYYHRNFS